MHSSLIIIHFRDGVWQYFLDTCALNLHVVLCMSPAGDALRNRCRNFPGLVGNTTIDWVFPWPAQALHAVAQKFIINHPKVTKKYKEPVILHIVHVHSSLGFYSLDFLLKLRRKNFVTPKHYLDFISTYLRLIGKSSDKRPLKDTHFSFIILPNSYTYAHVTHICGNQITSIFHR